jgi:hypothetical protein
MFMVSDDLETSDATAVALLSYVSRAIAMAFPGASLGVEPNPQTNNIVFYVNRADGARCVEVTETFLDAPEGLNSAFDQLEGLHGRLMQLAPGGVLIVNGAP